MSFGCGPSFQALYECDLHFEHCYALDQTIASDEAKRGCWRDWIGGYTFGQSRDRVEYASARLGELSGNTPRAREGDGGADDPPAAPVVATPVPTSAFAPPPNVSSKGGEAASAQSEASLRTGASAAEPPAADCTGACGKRWASCHAPCEGDGCPACDRSYRSCVPLCFRDDAGASRTVRPRH